MVEESEKRFEALMAKLFHSPPKPKPSSTNIRNEVLALSGRKRPHSSSVGGEIDSVVVDSRSRLSILATPTQSHVACKPWDRDDLFRRLSTFKSMTWFAKPQVMSPLECARRGWVNIDMDTIACASCRARLLFSTPSAWTQQQVEKAAVVFSLKLKSGHKLLCPWTDNASTEELAQFPIVSRAGLIENYKKRYFALSNLAALPVISHVAIHNMRGSKIEQFLSEPPTIEPLENPRATLPEHVPETISSDVYYQALKLTSLFGWEPHILPYKVELQDGQDNSIRNANVSITAGQKTKVSVYSLWTSENNTDTSCELHLDPSSVVLDCNLCGASVGLWAFCTTPQPVECLRFIGVTEVPGKIVTTTDTTSASEASSSCHKSSGDKEGLTITGGPPLANLNYGATISLPIIGPNLRARVSMEKGSNNHFAIQRISQVECQPLCLESENTMEEAIADPNSEAIADPNSEHDNRGGSFSKDTLLPSGTREHEKLSHSYKSMEFDPIKQHRHFCLWVTSTVKSSPGWMQTLSALVGLKEFDDAPQSTLIEVDDPVASVKRLLMIHESK